MQTEQNAETVVMEGLRAKHNLQIHVNEHLLDNIGFHKSIPFFSGMSLTTQ